MIARRFLPYFVGSMIVLSLLACAGGAQPTAPVPTAAPTATAVPATAAPSGHIQGKVYLQGPPTPKMVVYALDPATGVWASVEAGPADAEAPFDLAVQPGKYEIFGAQADGTNVVVGYAPDGLTLAQVEITAGQTITGINVNPPSEGECGAMVGYPASPDGRFAASAGPSADCLAKILTPTAQPGAYVPVTPEICGTIKDLAVQAIQLDFSMEPSAEFTDERTGEKGNGCTLTAMATGAKFSDPGSVLQTLVQAMQGWTEDSQYQAGGPTGAATGLRRDMALMLISVGWMPSPDVQCPKDQPISACNLKPEQQLYTVQIQTAMK